jgi:predicted metal-dependent enzyme (double-stranded beta helix superfamily)
MTLTLNGPVGRLFEEVAVTGDAAPDLTAIGTALAGLARDAGALRPWVDSLGDRSGAVAIHAPSRGPRLMLVHRLEGQMSAIHDHGTWVAISPVHGVETHRRWRRVPGRLPAPRVELAVDAALGSAEVATLLPPDDVHDHGHLLGRGDPAYVLILLGDDQTRYTRNEWDATTGRHRVLRPGDGGRWIANEPWPAPEDDRIR